MEFTGFRQEQFDVFTLPGFADRMLGIRTVVRPQLLSLGQMLTPDLSKLAGHKLYPHVALHARRRVNPPDDTWVAFGRESRGYKAYAHLAVGVSSSGVYIGLILKDEAADKATFGQHLVTHPEEAVAALHRLKGFTLEECGDRAAQTLEPEDLCRLGDALLHRSTSTLHLIRNIRGTDRRLSDPPAFLRLVRDTVKALLPVYSWTVSDEPRPEGDLKASLRG